MLFTSLLPRIGELFAQQATQVIAAGLLTGIVGGSVGVATGAIPVVDQPAQHATALFACPGSGRIVTSVAPNQDVLVTARSADGSWLEIYVGQAGVERGWAPASALQLQAAPDTLPVGDCEAQATPRPSVPPASPTPTSSDSPGPSATTPPSAIPTPRPTRTPKPSPTAVPTAVPTPNTGPTLSELTLQDVPEDPLNPGMYPVYPPGCPPGTWMGAPFTVRANDPDGIQAVYLYYQPLGGSVASVLMDWEGGDLYYGYLQTGSNWSDGKIAYWIQAVDTVGDTSAELHGDSAHVLVLTYCAD